MSLTRSLRLYEETLEDKEEYEDLEGSTKSMEKMILPVNVEENREDDNIEETAEHINNHYCFCIDGESDSQCPVQQCTFKTTDRYKMRLHFRDRHIKDIDKIRTKIRRFLSSESW